jgi:hypothetical protein
MSVNIRLTCRGLKIISLNIFSVALRFLFSAVCLAAYRAASLQSHTRLSIHVLIVLLISNHEAVSDSSGLDCRLLGVWGSSSDMAQRH